MSNKAKHVQQRILNDVPTPSSELQIVQVTDIRGTNILEVQYPNQERILCLMPAKFRKTVWVKKGGYVMIEPFKELIKKDKYKDEKLLGRIMHILLPQQIKELKKAGIWPQEFNEEVKDEREGKNKDTNPDDSDEDMDGLESNPNHVVDSDNESEEEWQY